VVRNQLEKPLEMCVHGKEVQDAVDLAPKIQELHRPRAPQWRVVATHSCNDGGVKPDHDGESFSEAHARGEVSKDHRSTTQDAKEPISHTRRRNDHPHN
jgi:hypothetical protein